MAENTRYESSENFIDHLLSSLKKNGNGQKTQSLQKFTNIYLDRIPKEEFKSLTESGVMKHLESIYSFFQTRPVTKDKKAKLRVFNPDYTYHSVVELVTDDQPFLMDTLWEELREHGVDIHHSFHPIITVKRNTKGELQNFNFWTPGEALDAGEEIESLIHIEFDRQESPQALKKIEQGLKEVIADARATVTDFEKMTGKLQEVVAHLEKNPSKNLQMREDIAFIKWLLDGNYIFLGYRHYDITHKKKELWMGLTHNSGLGIMRGNENSSVYKPKPLSELPPNMTFYVTGNRILTITRALTKSRVHRRADMDYIGIKEFSNDGKVIGEHRFLGLFSSKAYNTNARQIPIVGQKIKRILERESRLGTNTHNYKALVNILDTYPREELFQIDFEDLHRISTGILHLYERQKVKLFVRRSNHERMISAIVFIPRERMNSNLRTKVEDILNIAYNAESIEVTVTIGESPLARLFFKIRTRPPMPPDVSDASVERLIVDAATSWEDSLKVGLIDAHGEAEGLRLFRLYGQAFRVGYREHTPVAVAVEDVENLERIVKGENFLVSVHKVLRGREIHLKVFHGGDSIPLSDIMPIFDNMNLYVKTEHPNRARLKQSEAVWVHDFIISPSQNQDMSSPEAIKTLQQALTLAWQGELENDPLNSLILTAGMSVRQIVILRAYTAYMQQVTNKYSKEYLCATFIKHAPITGLLTELFDARFDPSLSSTASTKKQKQLQRKIEEKLKDVAVLDEDIILQRLGGIIRATIRTNAWQRESITDALAFKFRCADVPDLIKPHPLYGIFVYSSRVEGIHLRGGMIARGGIRWSDRPADYRTEVLGLMKTQMTKNSVIVPVGSKGGFVMKTPPCDLKDMTSCNPQELYEEVKNRYSIFISCLLSVTDNIINGKVVPPSNVRRYDDDDPYLVVAADKGTATFSDTANDICAKADYWPGKHTGFWLGDAFASGGSNGYDHKKMAITARGAWECVKHHFRTRGKDIQKEDFTAIGIGDMAGDVFGNGMLLSKHIRLQAAFNHMHIFIDPNPDAATGWKERKRLFALPRSSWTDYDKTKISKGGGIFSRTEKSISLSPQIQQMLGTKEKSMTPDRLVRLLLSMKVELLWNGGIGTFFKAENESHSDVGDRANDGIRLNGNQIGAQVFGEGGNLGLTQLARIEYAQKGGLINTDAIDNSAGVDCSDHEVNIKILLNMAMDAGKLKEKARNKLLQDMTDEVAELVLKDNYLQAQTITIKEQHGTRGNATNSRLIEHLEDRGLLDPTLEFLPDEETIELRAKDNIGFTRPELSVMLAYAKTDLYDDLIKSTLPDEPSLISYLHAYFPKPLQEKYTGLMPKHRLRREIIATEITNEMINRMGMTFLDRLRDELGQSGETITRAYLIAKDLVNAPGWWQEIENLDNKVPMKTQMEMLQRVKTLVEYISFWLLRNCDSPLDISAELKRFRLPFEGIQKNMDKHLSQTMKKHHQERVRDWKKSGLPAKIAEDFSLLHFMNSGPDIATIALQTGRKVTDIMDIHFKVGEELNMNMLHRAARAMPVTNNWQRVGSLSIVDDLYTYQKKATYHVVTIKNGTGTTAKAINEWVNSRKDAHKQYIALLKELQEQSEISHAMLNVVLGQLKGLTNNTTGYAS